MPAARPPPAIPRPGGHLRPGRPRARRDRRALDAGAGAPALLGRRRASRSCACAPASRRACCRRGCASSRRRASSRPSPSAARSRLRGHRARPLPRAADRPRSRAGTCTTRCRTSRSTPSASPRPRRSRSSRRCPCCCATSAPRGADAHLRDPPHAAPAAASGPCASRTALPRRRGLRRARRRPLHGRGARLVRRRARLRRRAATRSSAAS